MIALAIEWSRVGGLPMRTLGACKLYAPRPRCCPPPHRSTRWPHCARLVGCDEPQPLDRRTREAIGVDRHVVEARVARGRGTTRALLVVVAPDATLPRRAAADCRPAVAAHAAHSVDRHRDASRSRIWWRWPRGPTTGGRRASPRSLANRASLVDSDAETIRALGAATTDSDIVSHRRWVEILGREALTVRFYRALERAVDSIAESSQRRPTRRPPRARAAQHVASALSLLSRGERMARRRRVVSRAALRPVHDDAADGFTIACCARSSSERSTRRAERRARAAQRFGAIPFLNGGSVHAHAARAPASRQ